MLRTIAKVEDSLLLYFICTIVCVFLDLAGIGYNIYRSVDIPTSVRLITSNFYIGDIPSDQSLLTQRRYDHNRYLLHHLDLKCSQRIPDRNAKRHQQLFERPSGQSLEYYSSQSHHSLVATRGNPCLK